MERDPTENVLDLVEAAVGDLRARLEAANLRQDDLRRAEQEHVRELLRLRAEFNKEIRQAEAARLDSIRQVDVLAVQRSAEVMAAQATALAATVTTTSETMRTQVAAAADAAARALTLAIEPLATSVAELRRYMYETGSKAQTVEEQTVDRRGSTGLLIAAAAMVSAVVFGIVGVVLTVVLSG